MKRINVYISRKFDYILDSNIEHKKYVGKLWQNIRY